MIAAAMNTEGLNTEGFYDNPPPHIEAGHHEQCEGCDRWFHTDLIQHICGRFKCPSCYADVRADMSGRRAARFDTVHHEPSYYEHEDAVADAGPEDFPGQDTPHSPAAGKIIQFPKTTNDPTTPTS